MAPPEVGHIALVQALPNLQSRAEQCCIDHSPNNTSLAPASSPSGPATVVNVCPHRGPGGVPAKGNGLGLGAKGGPPPGDKSASIAAEQNMPGGDKLATMSDWQRSYLWLPIVGMTAQVVESACLLATAMTHTRIRPVGLKM